MGASLNRYEGKISCVLLFGLSVLFSEGCNRSSSPSDVRAADAKTAIGEKIDPPLIDAAQQPGEKLVGMVDSGNPIAETPVVFGPPEVNVPPAPWIGGGLRGGGSGGDLKIYMANVNSKNGDSAIDQNFIDELNGTVGVDFNRPTSYEWPNRGKTGTANPHSMIFVYGPSR